MTGPKSKLVLLVLKIEFRLFTALTLGGGVIKSILPIVGYNIELGQRRRFKAPLRGVLWMIGGTVRCPI